MLEFLSVFFNEFISYIGKDNHRLYEDKYICLVISTPKTIVMLWRLELYTAFVINNTYYFYPMLFVLFLFRFYALLCFCVSVTVSLCVRSS